MEDKVKIDAVDLTLASQDGKIPKKPAASCRSHGPRQKCGNCAGSIDPYDEEYLKEKNIKHMSFHAYVRKLTELHGRGSRTKPLENVSCKLLEKCPGGHKPYPKGICTKCRPTTLTLNRQTFRHVDNVAIENPDVVNKFLNFWRKSSYQRVGYLIGNYEPFTEVPLGIKAVVSAVYEPPQTCQSDRVKFEEDPNEETVEILCQFLGMKCVGWIFTDLWSADSKLGTVHCIRHEDSFLLSAAECITAGAFQAKHKNNTNYCYDGHFGSKFATVVATGDKSKQINFSGYQVSNQCTAMVDAKILCPTTHPELAWVRQTPLSERHYITDVQFTEKNEYGAEVRRDGRPLPVEFLLVDVPTGMPLEPISSFTVIDDLNLSFPIENRESIGENQNLQALGRYMTNFPKSGHFLEIASNFHFLLFLMNNDFVKFAPNEVEQLAKAVKEKNNEAANEWAENNTNWATLMELVSANEAQGGPAQQNVGGLGNQNAGAAKWSCAHCTFENDGQRADCAMCGLPQQ
ncbi:NPL4 family domain-containing protein [Ditylenchus destructor]|nr:NPL4 family domain-containing protein [Ditylenchus destructor]